jgi:hypothetical protein
MTGDESCFLVMNRIACLSETRDEVILKTSQKIDSEKVMVTFFQRNSIDVP